MHLAHSVQGVEQGRKDLAKRGRIEIFERDAEDTLGDSVRAIERLPDLYDGRHGQSRLTP